MLGVARLLDPMVWAGGIETLYKHVVWDGNGDNMRSRGHGVGGRCEDGGLGPVGADEFGCMMVALEHEDLVSQ
jgi:hypothetical protein